MDREAWLAERQTGVGASECAAVCGLSPWDTALGVYLRKTGQAPPFESNSAMDWGIRLEPILADAYAEITGRSVMTAEPNIRHPGLPWMLANPDRIIFRESQDTDGDYEIERLLEIKTASTYKADEWGCPGTDEVPEHYLLQVQHQLAVVGAICRSKGQDGPQLADVAVLIGGSDFRTYTVQRNDVLIARLIEIERAFWQDHVLARVAPEPDWAHERTPKLIEAMHGFDGGAIQLGEEAAFLVCDYEAAQAAGADADEVKGVLKAKLLHLLGTATLGLLPDGTKVTRKEVARKEYTVGATTYTAFKISRPKLQKQRTS